MKRVALEHLAAACFANWFLWFATALLIGGTPDSAASVGDRYYLSSHGSLTEVGLATYVYSCVHMVASVFGLLVFAITALYLYRTSPPEGGRLFGKWPAVVMVSGFLVSMLTIAALLLFLCP